MKKIIKIILWVAVVALASSQFFINGMKTNPPVMVEPQWDSPETRAMVERACFDCHSNETVWPWYSNIPPVSWLVVRDTINGRDELNFSEWIWADGEVTAEWFSDALLEGEMPMKIYLVNHPEARLTDAERQQLADSMKKIIEQ